MHSKRVYWSSVLCISLAACAGVDGQPEEEVESSPQEIINGTPLPAENSGFVQVMSGGIPCSGTLLTNEWVLTAKRCNVVAFTSTVQMGSQTRDVNHVVTHPTLDVAIAHLQNPMLMGGSATAYIRPLRTTPLAVGEMLQCYGYGYSGFDPTALALRSAYLQVGGVSGTGYTTVRNDSGQVLWEGDTGGTCIDVAGRAVGVQSYCTSDPISHDVFSCGAVRSDVVNGWVNDYGNLVPGATYLLRVKADGRYLQEDGAGDKLVSTRTQPNDDSARFILEPSGNEWRIKVKANGLYLHENGWNDKLVSTRAQPNDDFTVFRFTPTGDGSWRISVKADGLYLHEDGWNDKLVSTRAQPNDDFTRFYLIRQQPADAAVVPGGTYLIQVKADGRYFQEDGAGDKLVSTRTQPNDDSTRFILEPSGNEWRIKVKADGLYLHENGWNDKLVSTRAQPNDDFTRFFLEPAGTDWRIKVKADGLYFHENGWNDKLVSTRAQPNDDFTRFTLIRQISRLLEL